MNREQLSTQFSQALLSLDEIAEKVKEGTVFVDVRTDEEVAEGTLEEARCIPLDEIPARLDELSAFKEEELVIFCRVGGRADRAIQYLKSQGFQKLANAGGYEDILKSLA